MTSVALAPLRTLAFITRHPLTRGRPLGAVGRFLRWQLESRIREEIEFEWIEGARLAVRRGMTGATGNIYCGLHEFADMAFLLHVLRPGDLFLDVGANIGSYTVLASKVCGAQTVAFEPDPGVAAALRKNVELNDIGPLVQVHECALGGEDGETRLTAGLDTRNHLNPAPGEAGQTVRLRTLDGLAQNEQPILIKIDAEGSEEEVLAGASRTLAVRSLLAVETELGSPKVDSILRQAGFSLVWYDPFARSLSDGPVGARPANSLYVRNRPELEKRISSSPRRDVLEFKL